VRLRNRQLEHAVRRLALRELKRSRPLWKEYKRLRYRWLRSQQTTSRVSLIFVLALFFGTLRNQPSDTIAFALAVYGLGTVFRRAYEAANLLNQPDSNYFFLHHPVPDATVFRERMKHVLQSSTWMLVVFTTGLALIFRDQLELPTTWIMILGAALGIYLACLGGILALARLLPQMPASVSMMAWLLIPAAAFVSAVPRGVIDALHNAFLITPAGSVTNFIARYAADQPVVWLALLPCLIYIALLPLMFRQIAQSYSTAPQIEDLFGRSEDNSDLETFAEEDLAGGMASAVAERLIYEKIRDEPEQNLQWLDKFIQRQFSNRERTLYRFLCGGVAAEWTQSWNRGIAMSMLCVALATGANALPAWVVWICGGFAFFFALPLLGGSWIGFAEVMTSNSVSPVYALFPVGFRESVRVLLKVNITRILAASPCVALVFIAMGVTLSASVGVWALNAMLFVFGMICAQPMVALAKFSKGSNDTKVWGLMNAALLLAITLSAASFVVCWIALFFAAALTKAALAVAMVISSSLVFALYRFGYERCYWDLLREGQQ
jgi:hypothetical protein